MATLREKEGIGERVKRLLDRIGGPRALLIVSLVTLVGGVVLPWHEMLLTIGAVMFVFFLVAAGSPARTGIDEVHGSARWPVVDEVERWMAKNTAAKVSGAVVEMGEMTDGTRSVPLSWKTDKHVLIVASAGSGKGTVAHHPEPPRGSKVRCLSLTPRARMPGRRCGAETSSVRSIASTRGA